MNHFQIQKELIQAPAERSGCIRALPVLLGLRSISPGFRPESDKPRAQVNSRPDDTIVTFAQGPAERLLRWAGHGNPIRRLIKRTETSSLQLRLTRSEEHTSELQSLRHLVCRLLL